MKVTRRSLLVSGGAAAIAKPALAGMPRSLGGAVGSPSPPPTVPNPALIGTRSGSNYPDPQAWWNALKAQYPVGGASVPYNPSNPVQYLGQCDGSEIILPNGLDFEGVNTSAWDGNTGGPGGTWLPAILLTAAPGQNFNRNVRSNALRYNPANGAALNLTCTGSCFRTSDGTNQAFKIGSSATPQHNVGISNLQILMGGGTNVGLNTENAGGSFSLSYSILTGDVSGNPGGVVWATAGGTVETCLIEQLFPLNPSFSPNGIIIDNGGAVVNNTTIVAPSDLSAGPRNSVANEFLEHSPATTYNNCAFYGSQNFIDASSLSGGGSAFLLTACWTDNVVTGFTPPLTGITSTGSGSYTNQFQGITQAGGLDYRVKTGANLIANGWSHGSGIDISGTARPSGAWTAGCYEFATPTFTVAVNGFTSSIPSAVAGDNIRYTLAGIPGGTGGIRIVLTSASDTTQNYHEIRLSSPGTSSDGKIPLTHNVGGNYPALPAGSYAVAVFQVGSPTTPLIISQPFSVTAAVTPVFPPLNEHLWDLARLTASPVDAGVGANVQALAVHGTVTFGLNGWQNLDGNPHPTNVMMQFSLWGEFSGLPYTNQPLQQRLIGGQVTDAGGSPSVSFNTTTIPDGTYVLWCQAIDCNDTSGHGWSAYQLLAYPISIIVKNGSSYQSPTGTYLIPTSATNANTEIDPPVPDGLRYDGLPVYNTMTPSSYPGVGLTPVVAPPLTDPSSYPPWHSNPALARTGSWYLESVDTITLHEYRYTRMFYQTTAGGIFAGRWNGEGGDESIEGTYPAMAAESWLDGPRNSHTTTGNSIVVATVDPRRTGGAGPFDAYHWTIINIGGNLSVRDLAGNMKTIAGYKRDLTKLPVDYLDSSVGEFPNTVLVGTFDTAPATSISDFGGGANDCCWDPRNSNICYVAKTLDHCIMAVDFTATGPYGPTNPRIYRYAGTEGTAGYADGTPSTALFNAVYSICIQRVSGISGHPIGTMYVADNYNGLIRMITQTSPGVAGTVSTLCGLRGGTVAPGTAPGFISTITASATYTVSAITSNGDGTARVQLTAASPVSKVGWKATIQVGGSNYLGGGSTFENNTYGIYTVSAFTNSQDFSITMNPVPSGTITAVIWVADQYSVPTPVNGPGIAFNDPNCYTAYPQTVRMASNGDIILGEAWYNMMCRRIRLSGGAGLTNTITRIMAFGNLANIQSSVFPPGYGFLDVDDVGACGPLDDIVCFKTDSNPGSAAYTSRIAIDASYEANFFGGSDGFGSFPQEGQGGTGHYPWAFAWSKTQCRWIAAGKADTIFYTARPFISGSDPPPNTYDRVIGADANAIFLQGSPLFYPFYFRPSFAALYGSQGVGFFGQNVVPTLDDLATLYPSNFNTTGSQTGTLAGFIQAGMGGLTPRPEFSMDGAVPGRDLAELMYYCRRQSLPGSWPALYPNLFDNGDGSGAGELITPGTYSLNFIRPNISGVSATRLSTSPPSIQVTWSTDVPTLGIIAAGSANSAATGFPYNLWTDVSADNGGVYTAGSRTVTIGNLPPGVTHYSVLVKDHAGNWARTSDAVVS